MRGEATFDIRQERRGKELFQWIKFSLTYNQPQRWEMCEMENGECGEKKEKFLPTPTHITIPFHPYPIYPYEQHPTPTRKIYFISLTFLSFSLSLSPFSSAHFCCVWKFCHLFSPLIDFIVPINEYRMTYNGRNGRNVSLCWYQ